VVALRTVMVALGGDHVHHGPGPHTETRFRGLHGGTGEQILLFGAILGLGLGLGDLVVRLA